MAVIYSPQVACSATPQHCPMPQLDILPARSVTVSVRLTDRIVASIRLTKTAFWHFGFCAQRMFSLPSYKKLIIFSHIAIFVRNVPVKSISLCLRDEISKYGHKIVVLQESGSRLDSTQTENVLNTA